MSEYLTLSEFYLTVCPLIFVVLDNSRVVVFLRFLRPFSSFMGQELWSEWHTLLGFNSRGYNLVPTFSLFLWHIDILGPYRVTVSLLVVGLWVRSIDDRPWKSRGYILDHNMTFRVSQDPLYLTFRSSVFPNSFLPSLP